MYFTQKKYLSMSSIGIYVLNRCRQIIAGKWDLEFQIGQTHRHACD